MIRVRVHEIAIGYRRDRVCGPSRSSRLIELLAGDRTDEPPTGADEKGRAIPGNGL
jgi:hypothetical protein